MSVTLKQPADGMKLGGWGDQNKDELSNFPVQFCRGEPEECSPNAYEVDVDVD